MLNSCSVDPDGNGEGRVWIVEQGFNVGRRSDEASVLDVIEVEGGAVVIAIASD